MALKYLLRTVAVAFFLSSVTVQSQDRFINEFFDSVVMAVDTNRYLYGEHEFKGKKYLFFEITKSTLEGEIRLFTEDGEPFEHIEIRYSDDYEVIDDPVWLDDNHYRIKVRFTELFRKSNISMIFHAKKEVDDSGKNIELPLYPYAKPVFSEYNENVELFRGEEREIEIETKSAPNISADGDWMEDPLFEYQLRTTENKLFITFRAKSRGSETFKPELKLINPYLTSDGKITDSVPELKFQITVKPSRLVFLNPDKESVFMESRSKGKEEMQLDHHSKIELDRTYRVEDRQERGGRLIAEITPKSILGNNKVLCEVITYAFHRKIDGYLYMKYRGQTEFMTNFNIVSRPTISEVDILRRGNDWTESLTAYPGETIEVRIKGEGLSLTNFNFSPCEFYRDTTRESDRVVFYTVKIPEDIDRHKITILMNDDITQYELRVGEYERPRKLDFVQIDYGDGLRPVTDTSFNKAVFYPESIKDVTLTFSEDSIDTKGDFYGKQYIEVEARIVNSKNELVDIQTIEDIVVCPGESSERYSFYDRDDCNDNIINLNDHLLRKTYNMDDFSQLVLTIKHKEAKYDETFSKRKITIFAERRSSVDVQVSFPAGLLVKEFQESGIGNLTGISISVLAQMSFYDKKRIGDKKPYKFGGGFIAFNAFNFNDDPDIDRDIGLVILGSIEPIRSKRSFTFPIYTGVGYKMQAEDFFFIFGPGIQVQF